MEDKITEDYVSFETAKLLKEKGFDEECRAFYVKSKECGIELFPAEKSHNYNDNIYPRTSAPTLQMAMKWLRVEKGLYVYADLDIDYDEDEYSVKYYHNPLYYGNIVRTKDGEQIYDGGEMYDQPEYAVEAMIRYCLENLI